MLVEQITSRQNPLVKRAIRVRDGLESGHLFVEGVRLVEEALAAELAVEAFIHTPSLAESDRGARLLDAARRTRCRGALVPDALMQAIADVETSQGVALVAARPVYDVDDVFSDSHALVVALDGLQDPGNVGTIIRAAEAAGASGVCVTPGTAEPYSAKALRASMGSSFRLPIARRVTLDDLAAACRERGVAIVATAGSAERVYTDVDWRVPSVVLIGSEGAGLSDAALAIADATVRIPLVEPVESLNAATAAAVVLFEAARQRRGERGAGAN